MESVLNGRKAKKKNVQFMATFHLLRHGKPMTCERLFFNKKISNTPRKQ